MGVITTPFSGLVVQWYSWISEQVMAKENNTQSFSSVVSGWTKVAKEHHSRACLLVLPGPSDGACSCVGIASQKFCRDYFLQFGWRPRKQQNLITLENLCPYGTAFKEYSVAMYIQFSSCCCLGLGASV